MKTVVSKDGTRIAYEQTGSGPAIILVVGAFNERGTGAPLASALAQKFSVYYYDRRGRGDSGDTAPYAIEREIDDLGALIETAGGSACVFGYSSGAVLALRAAASGLSIARLALYEPPPVGGRAGQLAPQLSKLISAGRRGDAVELFQTEAVGIPAEFVAQLRNAPFRPALEKMAHTLVYESLILEPFPTGLASSIRIPTLVIAGGASPAVMRQAGESLAGSITGSRYFLLEGQGHDIVPEVVAPVLEEFFLAQAVGNKTRKPDSQ